MTKLEMAELAEWKRRLENPQLQPLEVCSECCEPQEPQFWSKDKKRDNERHAELLAKVLKEIAPCGHEWQQFTPEVTLYVCSRCGIAGSEPKRETRNEP